MLSVKLIVPDFGELTWQSTLNDVVAADETGPSWVSKMSLPLSLHAQPEDVFLVSCAVRPVNVVPGWIVTWQLGASANLSLATVAVKVNLPLFPVPHEGLLCALNVRKGAAATARAPAVAVPPVV